MIVKGGTPKQNSNRMVELCDELSEGVVEEGMLAQFQRSLKQGLPEIKANLEAWHNLDYHLVGSHGYVFRSGCMLSIVKGLEALAERGVSKYGLQLVARQLPRTYTFRKTVLDHILGEKA